MSGGQVIVLVIVLLVIVAVVVFALQASRRRKLQNTFGPEYDRAVADAGSRTDAEKELREREKRHAELELKELTPESKAQYSASWEEVQIEFVDNPEQAVTTADDLVTRLIAERGYPTGDYDDQLANLSVEHAKTLGHYRDAHDISTRSRNGEASTEDLRQALVHYRSLFADLLGESPVRESSTTSTTTTTSAVPAQTDADAPAQRDAVAPAQRDATTVNNNDVAGTRPDATSR